MVVATLNPPPPLVKVFYITTPPTFFLNIKPPSSTIRKVCIYFPTIRKKFVSIYVEHFSAALKVNAGFHISLPRWCFGSSHWSSVTISSNATSRCSRSVGSHDGLDRPETTPKKVLRPWIIWTNPNWFSGSFLKGNVKLHRLQCIFFHFLFPWIFLDETTPVFLFFVGRS